MFYKFISLIFKAIFKIIFFFLLSLEAPDVTGSSLTLGAAGSRRTVYLIDDNQKIPETADGSGGVGESTCGSSSSSTATLSGRNNAADLQAPISSQKSENPATFLMYNRISNIIVESSSNLSNEFSTSGSAINSGNSRDVDANQDESKLMRNKRGDDKNSSVWYEYGCV